MIWDILERVNKLRKEAMEDPDFLDSAKMHEQWLLSETHNQSKNGEKEKKPNRGIGNAMRGRPVMLTKEMSNGRQRTT
jgi:hypothetical protein